MSVLNKVNVISSIGYDCKICQKLSFERQENIAGVFSTYAYSWLTSGPELFIVNNSDGVLQSYWTFGENLQDDLEITCAVELPLEGCAIPLLILGISSENVNLICFFNPNTRKILRTIDIIYPVRTICIIEDGTNEVYPLNDSLTPTEGLIAVGCAEGTVLLIDLCRSILCKAVNGDFRFYSTEENPCEVVYVGVKSITSVDLSQKIVESRKKKNCVAVILTDTSDDGVTAMLYSVESAVLFVGTCSGSFHLWNMSSLSCLFKSPGTNRAIISLSLLEPCDDPRHSLYLWICFEEYAQVAMYCISFSSKFFVHGYGVYYQNFESAGLVYRFTLGMEIDMIAKRPICSQAVAKLVPKNLVRCISLPEAEGTHLRLFITAYEIFEKGQIAIRALIFDLNQWYRDQMPEEGVSACLDSIDLDSKSLWHLQLDPSTLTLYQCVRPQEQHFHPTAFDFQVWCIEEKGIRCLEKLGLQAQWLRNMSRMGAKAIVEPTQIFLGALAAGLLPSFIDPPDPEANDEIEERSYVLTICLENRITMVIEDCVKEWNNGCYSVRGCTIQFLLDWLWNLHRAYKANGNKICIPLFDQCGMKFDVSEKRSLQHCKSLLNTVQSVYTNIVNRFKNSIIVSGVEEKLTAMSLVRLYFDCCLKLISVNLLPEPNDLGRPSDSIVYHFDDINAYAIKRRKEGLFLGDSLLGKTDAEKQWLEEGGSGLYPPPSIQSVLRFCLHPSPSFTNKMSLLLYLFMDIINSYTPIRNHPVLDRIKNFQHLMRIPEVQYKIVAGCWYLDHSMFDEGMDLLFDPRVLCVDLSEDQHRGILHLLASEGQEKLALQYLRLKSPTLNLPDDLRMELNLLLSNGLVNEAFLFQRKHPEMRETLLIEFFEGCIERKQLGQVFGLNLDYKEEAALMKYLRSSGLREKGDLQVLLLLSKAKYTEAMFLNDKLNSTINGPKSRLETDTRDMIVRGITGSLNSISRHIANEMKSYRPPPPGSHPRPLSSLIKIRNGPDGPLCQTDSKVLLSAVAKSTRHLSDYVNSFESGHRRKREETERDVELENEPSRKRLKLLDTANNFNQVPLLSSKWLTSPSKPSASQKREVMELVGTPLVKKRGKRFSPQSRPSSILKGKTPEKGIIPEDFGETPKKSIRFALPENEIHITARKPLRENETTAPNKSVKIAVDNDEDETATPVKKEPNPPCLEKPSARKPLHGNDSLNHSVAGHNSSSVIETIKDRLRSSAKKKVLEGGVNWHEVAEASKPRVLFSQGVSKITSVTKSDKTQSSTPKSQVLLDITVTSAEKKYLDSPSRGEETSPVTEALFNTTLLPKVLFSPVNNEKEIKEESLDESLAHAAFLERYRKLRKKPIKSSNDALFPEEKKFTNFGEDKSFNVVCNKKTVELFKRSESRSSIKIVIDEDMLPEKESIINENILKESNDESSKPLADHENKFELALDKEDVNNESLQEKQEVHESLLEEQEEIHESLLEDQEKVHESLPEEQEDEVHKSLPEEQEEEVHESLSEEQEEIHNSLPEEQEEVHELLQEIHESLPEEQEVHDSLPEEQEVHESLPEEQEIQSSDIEKESLFPESEHILVNDKLYQDLEIEKPLHENDPLLNDDVSPCKDEDEIVPAGQEKESEWSSLKLIGVEGNCSLGKPIVNFRDMCDDENVKDKKISSVVVSNDKTYLNETNPIKELPSKEPNSEYKEGKNELLNYHETMKEEAEVPSQAKEVSFKEKSKEVSSNNKEEVEEIINIASDDDDEDNDDKHSYEESLTGEETEGMSEEYSEEIEEEEMSEKEENGSDNEGSLPEVSSISSDGDDVEKTDDIMPVHSCRDEAPKRKIKKDENVYSEKGPPGETTIIDISDEVDSDLSGDEKSKNKKKIPDDNTKKSKAKVTSQHEEEKQLGDEDVSDSEVFGLEYDKSDTKEEENSEDDMWFGLDNKESIDKDMKKSKQDDLLTTESSLESMLHHNFGSPRKELEVHKISNLKLSHSPIYSQRKSFSGSKPLNIKQDDVKNNASIKANLDISIKNSASELIRSEKSVLIKDTDCDISKPVSDVLVEKELIKDTALVKVPEEKLVSENERVAERFFVEDPVIEAVTSLPVEEEAISDEEVSAGESQPVSSPLITEVPSSNEHSCSERFSDNAEEDLNLKEDFQSIERNWTQQIEEEMKKDSAILEIECENRGSINLSSRKMFNVDDNKFILEEITDQKSVDNSECKESKNFKIDSSFHTSKIEYTQNNILVTEELKSLSKSFKIDRKDISLKGAANCSLKGDDAQMKETDDISPSEKPEGVFPVSENKCEADDLLKTTVTPTEIIVKKNIVSNNEELTSTRDETNKPNSELFDMSTDPHKEQSVVSKENESNDDEKDKGQETLYDSAKRNYCDNSDVSLLKVEVKDQYTIEKDCHVSISKDNNDIVTITTVLLSQEILTQNFDNTCETFKEKSFSSEASSVNFSNKNNVNDISSNLHHSVLAKEKISNNIFDNLSTEKKASFSSNEKCKLPDNNFSKIDLTSDEAGTNKASENFGEYSDKSLVSASEKCNADLNMIKNDSVISFSITTSAGHEKLPLNCTLNERNESVRVTDLKEVSEKYILKKDDNDKHAFVISDTIQSLQNDIVEPGSKVSELPKECEIQISKLSAASEHEKETLDSVSAETGEKYNGSCIEVGGDKINEVSDRVKSKNVDTDSEVINKSINDVIPIRTQEERLEIERLTPPKQEDNHVRDRTDDEVVIDTKEVSENDKLIDKISNSRLSSSNHSYQPNLVAEDKTFESAVKLTNSENVTADFDGVANNNLSNLNNADRENASKINPIVCENKENEDKKVVEENISLCLDEDVHPDLEPLDSQLNNAKIDVFNDSSTVDALNTLKKEEKSELQNISNAENNSEKPPIEKSFFFGKEDIETYIRSTKATFQIGGRMSLPEEDEPVDPMEVAMIEEEEKSPMQPPPSEPDIGLSLHLSPDHLKKPKKVDQGIVTENSYLQRRARKLRKSANKKLLSDESCDKESENKIIVNSEDHVSNVLSTEKELKCISTQTSVVVLGEIDLSESEEELTDYAKMPGPSQKSVELKKKITQKMRQSSEPSDDLKRKSSICTQKSLQDHDIKGILKKKDSIDKFDEELKPPSKADHLPVRRSRRLSESILETNELLRNQSKKDHYMRSLRKSRGFSEEPDFYKVTSYKNKESTGYHSSENEKETVGKDDITKQRRSRRHSEEPEMRSVLIKDLEKRKSYRSSHIDDEYVSKRSSKGFSDEPDVAHKYHDERRRNSKNLDYDSYNFEHSEEPELRGILKKSSKGSRKTSISCETINELKHYEESDTHQESRRKSRSQSEEPENLEIPKKRYRLSRRGSHTYETAADFHSQVEEISTDNRKTPRHLEDTGIQGILKKRSSHKPRSSLVSEAANEMKMSHRVDQSEENRESRKHSEGEIQGILKKNRKECRSSDNEKLLADILPEKNRRSRRYSEEPEMLKPLKKRERRASQSSDCDNEFNLPAGVRRMRRHSEEPEVRGILKKQSNIGRKSLHYTETVSDLKLLIGDDLPYENRKSKEQSEESDVKGILKKSRSSRRRNSDAGETNKGIIHLDKDSPENKNSHILLDHDSLKAEIKRSNVSRTTDSISSAKIKEVDKSDEESLANKNTLKNQNCSHVSSAINEKSYPDDVVKMVTDADVDPRKGSKHSLHPRHQAEEKDASVQKIRPEGKEIDSLSSAELISGNKKVRRSSLLSHEEEHQSVKESPAKVRRRSSFTTIAKEEPVEIISIPEEETKNIRRSLRRTPDRKDANVKIVEERKKRESHNSKLAPKRLDYSDDEENEFPEKKKSRSLIDFPIKRNSRLPRPALEDIREEDEDLLKKKKKSMDDLHLEKMKKKATSKKQTVSKLIIEDSDADSDVSTPELWKKDLAKEKRLTRTQQKLFLMNQQLTSVSEVESPSTSSPRRNIRKKADVVDSPVKTPTRSSLRLQKKPPSETD